MRPHLFLFVVLLLSALPAEAEAQDLLQMYRRARVEAQAAHLARAYGARMQSLPPRLLPSVADSMRRQAASAEAVTDTPLEPPAVVFTAHSWRAIRRLESGWFERIYGDAPWAYLGNTEVAPLDTSWTRMLRGRLEAHFGAPTQTLVESLSGQGQGQGQRPDSLQEYIQFEYWFVVNDTIPVRVMDTNGPFERGLVMATNPQFRRVLPHLRRALYDELKHAARPEPYADYFFNPEEQVWYRTGYDGTTFYVDRISRPALLRRPPPSRR